MKKVIGLSLIGVLSLGAVTVNALPAPPNLWVVKQALLRYHDSGQYAYGLWKVAMKAKAYLQKRIAENKLAKHKKKLAIVLDIDETSLSNYAANAQTFFSLTSKQITQHLLKADDSAIPGTLNLYRYAEAHHVAVFFITGRHALLRQATIKNLKAVGYTQWNGLYLKPNTYRFHSAIPFKSSERRKIEARGYDIVLSIGDQYSDLVGGYDDAMFKLPNPFYYVP